LKGDPVSGETHKAVDTEVRKWIDHYLSTGDKRAWGGVFETFKLQIFNTCRSMLRNDEDARDLTSDTFIKAMEKIHLYDRNQPFFPWLLRIAKNLCIDQIRHSRRIPMDRLENWEKIQGEPASVPDDTTPKRIGRIRKAILGLKKPQKVCFCLFYMHEKSYRDISEITGYTYDEVRSHIQNGRRNFKLLME
jgi:RNA polymerase sigma factor (sigma-70 family)